MCAEYVTHAQRYLDLGYIPIPIQPNTKRPSVPRWQDTADNRDWVADYILGHPNDSLGLLTGEITALDGDILDTHVAKEVAQWIQSRFPTALPRVGARPKFLFLFGVDQIKSKRASAVFTDAEGRRHRIELLGKGQQFVAHGVHPQTNQPYLWPKGSPVDQSMCALDLPTFTDADWEEVQQVFEKACLARGFIRQQDGSDGAELSTDTPFPMAGLTLEDAREALDYVPNDDLEYDDYLSIGLALHQQSNGDREWFDVWDAWASSSVKNSGTAYNWQRWRSFDSAKPGGLTMRSILQRAEFAGWTRPGHIEGAKPDDTILEFLPEDALPDQPAQPIYKDAKGNPIELFDLTSPAQHLNYQTTPQEWVWDLMLPKGETTVLYADGGTGKTSLAQLLATHIATGQSLFGTATNQGKVIAFLAEDDLNSIIRRQDRIRANGGPPRDQLHDLTFIPRKGEDNAFMVFHDDIGRTTPTWQRLAATCMANKDKLQLLIVDTAADTFGGSENIRTQVRQYIQRALTRIAVQCDCAVLLLAHPSRTGMQDGTGGSTAWHNTVRSRWHLYNDPEREGVLVLAHRKSNYGPKQPDKLLRLVDGVPILLAGEEAVETDRELQCRSDLLTLCRAMDEVHEAYSNAKRGQRYLPLLATRKQRSVLGSDSSWKVSEFESAMDFMIQRGQLLIETERRGTKLRIADIKAPEQSIEQLGDEAPEQ